MEWTEGWNGMEGGVEQKEEWNGRRGGMKRGIGQKEGDIEWKEGLN